MKKLIQVTMIAFLSLILAVGPGFGVGDFPAVGAVFEVLGEDEGEAVEGPGGIGGGCLR